jgi:hypothetical protein
MRWLDAMQAAMQIAAVVSILTECIFSNRWLNQQPMCNSIFLRLPASTLLCPLHTCFADQSLGLIHSLVSGCLTSCKVFLYMCIWLTSLVPRAQLHSKVSSVPGMEEACFPRQLWAVPADRAAPTTLQAEEEALRKVCGGG